MLVLPRPSALDSTPRTSTYYAPSPSPPTYHTPSRPHAIQRARPSLIERLPPHLQMMVFSHLDYQSLIHLSTMNRHFSRTVSPQTMADPAEKAQFVLRAAKDFPQHRPCEKGQDFQPGNFECYACFRVRGPEHFDIYQRQFAHLDPEGRVVVLPADREPRPGVDRQVALRRFCIGCGVALGLHAAGECLTTKTGRDLWVCRCSTVWAKPGCLRCPRCRADCPLRPRRKS